MTKMKCVVGGCEDPTFNVKRCYWSVEVMTIRKDKDHAYLDLCGFHQGMLESHRCSTPVIGWDPIKED